MDIVLKLNEQLKETEKELDNLIQYKQSELATTPQTIISTISTAIPSSLATTLAPTLPLAIALLVTGTLADTGTSKSTGTPIENTIELIKAMEEMSIHDTELKKLREQVTSLETNCKLAQI